MANLINEKKYVDDNYRVFSTESTLAVEQARQYSTEISSEMYNNFISGNTDEAVIEKMAQSLYKTGDLNDELIFYLEYLCASNSPAKSNIIKVENAIHKRVSVLEEEARKQAEREMAERAKYVASLSISQRIKKKLQKLMDVRNYNNFRETLYNRYWYRKTSFFFNVIK